MCVTCCSKLIRITLLSKEFSCRGRFGRRMMMMMIIIMIIRCFCFDMRRHVLLFIRTRFFLTGHTSFSLSLASNTATFLLINQSNVDHELQRLPRPATLTVLFIIVIIIAAMSNFLFSPQGVCLDSTLKQPPLVYYFLFTNRWNKRREETKVVRMTKRAKKN